MFVQSDFSKANNNGHGHRLHHHGHHRPIDIVTPSNHNRHPMQHSHPQSDDLFKDLDLISRFCMPICSRDNDVREGALEAIAKTVEGWLDGVGSPKHYRLAQTADRRRLFSPMVYAGACGSVGGTGAFSDIAGNAMIDVPPEYLDLIALHLPIILRLSISCPFINVREKCQHILDIVQSRGLPIPYPVIYGPCAFVGPDELPPLGTYNEKTVIVKIKALIKIVDMGSTIARPRFKRRRVIYNIVMYYLYEVFLLVMVLCSIALMFADVATRGNYDIIMQLKGAIVAIFFIDMINKIIAFSHIYIRQGFMIYFCNSWNQFDFILLILLCMDIVVVYYCRPCQIPDQVIPFGVIKGFVSIQFFKLWKFVFILKRFEYNILAFLDKMIGLRIMLAVDIGEAMIKSYDEILHTMPKMVENKDVCAAIMAQVKADRQIIKLELLNRTSERDWIMVTCKTHQMIRNCLYEMRLKIEELWVKGSISDYEYDKLRMSQEACLQNFFKLNSISKPSEHDLIANLGYILNDAVCDYCLNNAIKVKYRKDEEVLSMGRRIDGILVMASGLVQVTYEPFDADIYQRYGALPGVDDIEEELLFEPRSYSIMCGNILGEMGLLTQRPYHCRAVALEDSEFLAIPKSILEDATIMNTGSIHQLMWMHVTAKLLNSILWRTKPFQGCSENEVLMHVYKGYYPNLNDYASIERSKSVQDIVLIEGVVWDMATKDMFIAPCYLPRNVRFIGFSRSRHYMVNPKLFLIPVDESKMKLILKELEKTSRPRTDYDKVWEPGPGIIQDLVMSSLKPTHLFVELPPTYDDGEGRESMFYYNSEAFGAPYPRLKEMEKPPPPPSPVVQRNARMVISTKEIDSDAYFAEGPPAKRLRLESDSDLDFENLSKSKDD